ncbi:MAG: hypothetical protein EA349_13685, partial [Halomonadaceae bacterium]
MPDRQLDLNRVTVDHLVQLLEFTQQQAQQLLRLRQELGGFASVEDFMSKTEALTGITETQMMLLRRQFYTGKTTEPGTDPGKEHGPEPWPLEELPPWSLVLQVTPEPLLTDSSSSVQLRLEYQPEEGGSAVAERHRVPLGRVRELVLTPVAEDTDLTVTVEDNQGHELLPPSVLKVKKQGAERRLRAELFLDTKALKKALARHEPDKSQNLARKGRFRIPTCPESRFDEYVLAVDLVDTPDKVSAVRALLGQESEAAEGGGLASGSRQLDPADEIAMAHLGRFNLTGGDLKFDGAFSFTRPLPQGDEQPVQVKGWFWLLMGPRVMAGFRHEAHPNEPASQLTLLLPAGAGGKVSGNGGESPGSNGCGSAKHGCGDGRSEFPLDVNEDTLLDHPDRFSDDPGPFCKPFSNPNRILSERTFHTVLRVEEPEIESISPSRPNYQLLLPDQLPERQRMAAPVLAAKPLSVLGRLLPQVRPGITATALFRNPFMQSSRRHPAGSRNLIDWEGNPARHQAQSVVGGHVLEWRVQTRSNGYSLGDVKRTLTLAPRQSRRVVKLDWERRERARRDERTISDDEFEHVQERDMNYDTAVASNLQEWSRGGSDSSTSGAAGGIGGFFKGIVIGGGASHGRSSSSSWQQGGRSIAASEEQKLRDAIRQYGDSLRALESTVVTEAEQEESVQGVSEVVRNANYCHALSVIYYEIVRHMRIDTSLGGVRECLFVPFVISPFTEERLLRWRDTFQRHLRQWRLRWVLRYAEEIAAVARLGGAGGGVTPEALDEAWGDIPSGQRQHHSLTYLSGSLWIRLGIERPREGDAAEELEENASESQYQARRESNIIDALAPYIPLIGGTVKEVARELNRADDAQIDAYFRREVAPTMARNWVEKLQLYVGDSTDGEALEGVNFTLASSYRHKGLLRVDFTLPQSQVETLQRSDTTYLTIAAVSVEEDGDQSLPPHSVADLSHASINYETRHDKRRVNSNRRMRNLVNTAQGTPNTGGGVLYFALSAYERQDMRVKIQEAYDALLTHVNNHQHLYHRLIWQSMDRNELHTILDGYALSDTDSRSLASVVEHQPMGVLGNSLIFRVAAGAFVGVDGHESLEDAFNYYHDGNRGAQPIRVTLPSDGVYAQALMDECHACEEHFGSTDWILEDKEPELADLPGNLLQSRREQPRDLDPTSFPQPMINLQNIPPLPQTQGLGGALSGVTQPDAFRDMAGLEGTQQGARAAMESAAGLAAQFGSHATQLQLAKQQLASGDLDRYRAALERGVEKGLITQEQASERFNQRAGEAAGGAKQGKSATDEQVDRVLEEHVASGQPMTLTRMDEAGYSHITTNPMDIQQVGFFDRASGPVDLIRHLSRWIATNADWRHNNTQMRADENPLAAIGSVGAAIDEVISEAAEAAKCEYHGITFTSAQSQDQLFQAFRNFSALIDPAVVQVSKIAGDDNTLAVTDQFRFNVVPGGRTRELVVAVMRRISIPGVPNRLLTEVGDYLARRRFDIEVIDLEEGADHITMTVQTL